MYQTQQRTFPKVSSQDCLDSLVNLLLSEQIMNKLNHSWLQKKAGKLIFNKYTQSLKTGAKNEERLWTF